EGKVFLRDIIDLEATYAGPDAKAMPAPVVIGPDGQLVAPQPGAAIVGMQPLRPPATVPAAPSPFKAAGERAEGAEGAAEGAAGEGDFDDDDMENSLSLAAIEA